MTRIRVSLLALLLAAGMAVAKDKPAPITDDSLTDQVRLHLASDRELNGGGLMVTVKDGVVSLSGTVENEKQRKKAEKVAAKVKGVRQVVNRTTLRTQGKR
jgi:osmotically-inducible protein OsmY